MSEQGDIHINKDTLAALRLAIESKHRDMFNSLLTFQESPTLFCPERTIESGQPKMCIPRYVVGVDWGVDPNTVDSTARIVETENE